MNLLGVYSSRQKPQPQMSSSETLLYFEFLVKPLNLSNLNKGFYSHVLDLVFRSLPDSDLYLISDQKPFFHRQ